MDRDTYGFMQMGGEGNGQGRPFSNTDHIFQNIGDGNITILVFWLYVLLCVPVNVTYKSL